MQFWVKQLNVPSKFLPLINPYQNQGYCSTKEIQADIKGYYKFYTKQRFVLYLFYIHLLTYFMSILYIYKISSIN